MSPAPDPPLADRADIESRVKDYFRKTSNLPDDATLTMARLAPAPIPGWHEGNLEVSQGGRSQAASFLVSNDGRYLFRGEVSDLTVDPFKANAAKISLQGQPIRGDSAAPVTIVAFSDFQCPYCARAARSLEVSLLRAYPGKVRLVYKNLPLTQIHPWAESAAIAGECAFLQGNEIFWTVHDHLFQEQEKLTASTLKSAAARALKGAGGDTPEFLACVDNRATVPQVQADVAEAAALGVNSTPTFFVNGRRVSGAQPVDGFKAVIEAELSQQ